MLAPVVLAMLISSPLICKAGPLGPSGVMPKVWPFLSPEIIFRILEKSMPRFFLLLLVEPAIAIKPNFCIILPTNLPSPCFEARVMNLCCGSDFLSLRAKNGIITKRLCQNATMVGFLLAIKLIKMSLLINFFLVLPNIDT